MISRHCQTLRFAVTGVAVLTVIATAMPATADTAAMPMRLNGGVPPASGIAMSGVCAATPGMSAKLPSLTLGTQSGSLQNGKPVPDICLTSAELAAPAVIVAEAGSGAEKDAFNSAKELGTADAWNAFLTSYPSGFHADLARAYLKQLGGGGAAAPAAPPPVTAVATTAGPAQEMSCSQQQSLRSLNSNTPAKITFVNKSGMHRGIMWLDFNGQPKDYAALNPGEQVTLDTYLTHPWMATDGPGDCKQIFMPAGAASVADLTGSGAVSEPKASRNDDDGRAKARRAAERERAERAERAARAAKAKKKVTGCEEGYKLVNGKCKKRTKKDAPGGCPPGTVPVPETDNCVLKTDKNGFEVAPWTKPGCKTWQKACSSGNNAACGNYEANCQVN